MLPFASISSAPYEANNAPQKSTQSPAFDSPSANGMPAFWQASAAFRCASHVHASAPDVYSLFTGYIDNRSSPAFSRSTPIRATGG